MVMLVNNSFRDTVLELSKWANSYGPDCKVGINLGIRPKNISPNNFRGLPQPGKA
jgi:hypothetical protein